MGPSRTPTTPATRKPSYAFAPTAPETCQTLLPMPPEATNELRFEMEIYARFMRHLRDVPNSRMEIKVLSAIQFTASMMNISDALVAKTLVDLGLRAPRRAFPGAFLDFADRATLRTAWSAGGGAPASIQALGDYWQRSGESPFAHLAATVALKGKTETVRA